MSTKKREKSQSSNILFLDTSTDRTIVAVYTNDELLKQKNWLGKSDLSETLLPVVDEILKSFSLKIADLDLIAVNTGPGSYTGLRIGLSVANAIAWSLNIPLVDAKIVDGKLELMNRKQSVPILPHYSHPPKITQPKK